MANDEALFYKQRERFNVPFGQDKSISYAQTFPTLREALSQWEFTAGDGEAVALKSGDFVYADPPYDVEFTCYSQGGFSWPDQERTARAPSRHDGLVVLVNQATTRIEKLYRSLGYAIRFGGAHDRRLGPRDVEQRADGRARELRGDVEPGSGAHHPQHAHQSGGDGRQGLDAARQRQLGLADRAGVEVPLVGGRDRRAGRHLEQGIAASVAVGE